MFNSIKTSSKYFCFFYFRQIFGWYNFFGYISTAMGALTAGYMIWLMTNIFQILTIDAYRNIILAYAFFGGIKTLLYLLLSNEVEVKNFDNNNNNKKTNWFDKNFGLHQSSSRRIIAKLSALFIIDSIAGGFILQTTIVYWFHIRFKLNIDKLGLIMMCANIISGLSAILSTKLVSKFGAIYTMVITHVRIYINIIKIEIVFFFLFRFHQIFFY